MSLYDHLMRFVEPEPNSGCWLWAGFWNRNGYGQAYRPKSAHPERAHRLMYEAVTGVVPSRTLDHLCRTRACVNPAHLEHVSQRENVIRGVGPAAVNASKSACAAGHEFTESNTYVDRDGWRHCRTCRRENNRNWWRTRSAS